MLRGAQGTWRNPALSVLVCAAAGAAMDALGGPLPWMIGPMLAMAACNLSGLRCRAPRFGRETGQLVIGMLLGLYFTPQVAREVASYWPLLLTASALALGLGWLSGWVLQRLTGADAVTAFFSSVPGGASEMAFLAERFGGRVDRVAVAQSLRILLVVMLVPTTLTFLDLQGSDHSYLASRSFDTGRFSGMSALALIAGGLLARWRVANAFFLGPVFVTIGWVLSGTPASAMPASVSHAGQILLGCVLGTRVQRDLIRALPRFVAGVVVTVVFSIVVAAAAAAGLAAWVSIPLPTLVLATAPGGVAEMCITATVLHQGVAMVTAAHVTRVVVLVSTTGLLFRGVRRLRGSDREGGR